MTNKSSYGDLKKWFVKNMETLPDTLDGLDVFYTDVRKSVGIYIAQIDDQIEIHGEEKIQESAIAQASKRNLFFLWRDLQDRSRWNAKLKTLKNVKK